MGLIYSMVSQKNTIDLLNEQQKIFFVSSSLINTSKNSLFIAFRRIFDTSDKIPYDKKKCYALKLIDYYNEKNIENFDRETNILDLFQQCPQIIKYEDIMEITVNSYNHLLISMRYYAHSDLFNYLWRKDFNFDESLIQKVAFQSLKILQILKSRNVVHNDIKFENFIVESEKPFKIILTDFESSQILLPNEKSVICQGTPVYESPEVLRREAHDYAADMWSLGANIYTTVFGTFPFDLSNSDSIEVMKEKVENNVLLNIDNVASVDCWECITKMLAKDPDERIDVEDALRLSWFKSVEADDVKGKVAGIDSEANIGSDLII